MLYMLAWNLMLHSSFSQHVHKSRSLTTAKTRHSSMAQASAKQVCCQMWVISTVNICQEMEMEMFDGACIIFSYDFHMIFHLFSQIFISQFFPKLWDLARCGVALSGAEPLGQRHRLPRRRRASGPGYVAVGAGVEELLPWGPGALGRLGRGEHGCPPLIKRGLLENHLFNYLYT